MQSLLKMFNLSTAPTVALADEEISSEADEPPDNRLRPLREQPQRHTVYSRAMAPSNPRRESLLTRAIRAESKHDEHSPTSSASRGLSTTSSHSTASTAELTSDADITSPSRSATPSPPPLPGRFAQLLSGKRPSPSKVVIAPVTRDDKPSVADLGEAAVEKTLGRKRCIMFACGGTESEKSKDDVSAPKKTVAEPEVPKRKCMLTFACPTRTSSTEKNPSASKLRVEQKSPRLPSPAPPSRRKSSVESVDLTGRSAETAKQSPTGQSKPSLPSPQPTFHEFGSSHDETDAWIDRPSQHQEKLTLDDCMRKENEIRQIGKEAEEEAEEEEREQEEFEEELEFKDAHVDDFAPSEEESDGGNESDDEGGFASSDDESDAGSDYQFWAPSRTTTRATSVENMHMTHFSSRRQSDASSIESEGRAGIPAMLSMRRQLENRRGNAHRISKMRPGTPELPDSTDFVCGTLDEDRPLEAAYISCRELRKREKHIPIPQDIDPSFPTTDPEEEEDEVDDVEESQHSSDGPRWLTEQFGALEDLRGRPKALMPSPQNHSPRILHPARRGLHRSPAPKHVARSPPPRKLFGHSPTRMRSPPPPARLRSPRGSPTGVKTPQANMRGLAQRPNMERTASLPDTPNPFFKNFKIGSTCISNIASGAVTPSMEEPPRADMHVRGPVDIVIGLEKKRQKRKEKFWRQHCRKAAREQAERKPLRGRGAERMRELGLECAERMKGYGIGQQTQLVISL